jgi:hypothetical protein
MRCHCPRRSGSRAAPSTKFKAKGLIDHIGAARGDNPPPLRITRAGLQAIGVETEDDASERATRSDTGATSADAGVQATDARPVTEAAGSAAPTKKGQAAKGKVRVSNAAAADRPTPRAGTKQALMIDLLKRPKGATVEQIAGATGWQHHTDPWRYLRRAQEEARAHRRGHPHARGRAQ